MIDGDRELGDHPAGTAREQDDAVTESDRLADVVGDEEDAHPGLAPDPLDFVVERVAGHGIEGAERLVHEEHVGALAERPGERDPLTHATRQLVGALVGELAQVHELEQLQGPGSARRSRHPVEAQRQLDVSGRGEPREQRRLLEQEAGPPADREVSPAGLIETRHQAEQGALAAAGRAEHAHEAARLDVERHPVQRVHGARGISEDLREIIETHHARRVAAAGHRGRDSAGLAGGASHDGHPLDTTG